MTPDDFIPSLLPSDTEKIDNLLKLRGSKEMPPAKIKQAVIGGKNAKPRVGLKVFKQKNPSECSFCNEVKDKDLMICSSETFCN